MNELPPLTEEESEALKGVIRENLQAIHEFCEEYGLTYYLSDGTLLGAIRHKGMIPWDDDADICMPRHDYERLLSLKDKLPEPYRLGHFSLDESYIYPFIKFMNSKTQIIEYFGDVSYKAGVWVDIFPLDGTYKNQTLRKIHYSIVYKLRLLFQLRVRSYSSPKDKRSIIKYWFRKLVKPLIFYSIRLIPKRLMFNIMEFSARHVCYSKADFVGNLYTIIGIKASHKKKWFEDKHLRDFDGYRFYAPDGYDKYLSNLYGDYMTPPPPKERQVHNIKILKL